MFVVEEYFKTKPFDLCSEWFELKLSGVSIPNKSTIIYGVVQNKKSLVCSYWKQNRKRTVLNEEMLQDVTFF